MIYFSTGASILITVLCIDMFLYLQELEVAINGYFDAVLDTIGVPETERTSINLLKKGGHYMTLQVSN